MNEKVVIVGAGGHAKVLADIVRKNGDIVMGFLDDDISQRGKELVGANILGVCTEYAAYVNECSFIIAIGNDAVRKRLSLDMDCKWYTAVHPSAQIGEAVTIGEGTCVMAGAVINSCAAVGKHCIVNTCASVDHDCSIGNYVHVSVGAHVAGTVKIGDNTWIGAGAIVSNDISITEHCIVGAGAVVVKDLQESGIYIGVPARKKTIIFEK